MNNWHQSQRGYMAGQLFEEMLKDDRIYLVTADLGYGAFDKIKNMFPDRFINCGASEQAGLGICVGLAQEGKKPFYYTITSFLLRSAETISLYLEHEKCPVRLLGAGRGDDYSKTDGYSHNCVQAEKFVKSMKFVEGWPETKEQVPDIIKYMVENDVPSFISLKR
jgi:transketolase